MDSINNALYCDALKKDEWTDVEIKKEHSTPMREINRLSADNIEEAENVVAVERDCGEDHNGIKEANKVCQRGENQNDVNVEVEEEANDDVVTHIKWNGDECLAKFKGFDDFYSCDELKVLEHFKTEAKGKKGQEIKILDYVAVRKSQRRKSQRGVNSGVEWVEVMLQDKTTIECRKNAIPCLCERDEKGEFTFQVTQTFKSLKGNGSLHQKHVSEDDSKGSHPDSTRLVSGNVVLQRIPNKHVNEREHCVKNSLMNMGVDLSCVMLNSQTSVKDAAKMLGNKEIGVLIVRLSKKEKNLLNEKGILSEGRYLVFQSVHCVALIMKKETFVVSDPACKMAVEQSIECLKNFLLQKKNKGHFNIRKVHETKKRKRRLNEKHDDDLLAQLNKKIKN